MARDDYFVLAYRILHYLYSCLKNGEVPDRDFYGPAALEIPEAYWNNVMRMLQENGYITGLYIIERRGGFGIKTGDLRITQAGIEFLTENSMMKKAEKFLATAKDIIPGF